MAIADTITTLGNNIVSLIGTRANKDLSNLSATGNAKLTASSASVPVGTVIAYMGTTVPDGFLLMDGREVSKTTYSDLYAVIGDTQGTATDSTKFCIADMTDGRYLMGSTVAGGRCLDYSKMSSLVNGTAHTISTDGWLWISTYRGNQNTGTLTLTLNDTNYYFQSNDYNSDYSFMNVTAGSSVNWTASGMTSVGTSGPCSTGAGLRTWVSFIPYDANTSIPSKKLGKFIIRFK